MKKNLFLKIFVSISALYFLSSASAQYFKPSIDGSWLISFERTNALVSSHNNLLIEWKSIFFKKYFKTSLDNSFRFSRMYVQFYKPSRDGAMFKQNKYLA